MDQNGGGSLASLASLTRGQQPAWVNPVAEGEPMPLMGVMQSGVVPAQGMPMRDNDMDSGAEPDADCDDNIGRY